MKAMKEVSSVTSLSSLTTEEIITSMEDTLVKQLAAYIIQVRADHDIYGELQKNLK